MSVQTAVAPAHYVYAVVGGVQKREYGFSGINGAPVYSISNGDIAAVVSDVPNEKIRPERRHLAAHWEVLNHVMDEAAVLPVSFGIIGESSDAIRKLLSRNEHAFVEQLQRVAGKVEMGLRVAWDVANIFEYFVHIHQELRAMRDQIFRRTSEPSHEEMIQLGRRFEQTLAEDRTAHTEKVEAVLASRCFDIKRLSPRAEQEVMNLACLVGRDAVAGFKAGVFEAAALFDDNFAFDYNGPWAPHNFVELNISL